MGGKLGVKSCTQAPEAVSVIDLDLKLLGQLPVDRLDDLAHLIEETTNFGRDLSLLVGAGQCQQTNATVLEELFGQLCVDKAFVANHGQVTLGFQHLTGSVTFISIGTHQLKVEDGAANSDQEIEPIAVDGSFLGRAASECCTVHIPIT